MILEQMAGKIAAEKEGRIDATFFEDCDETEETVQRKYEDKLKSLGYSPTGTEKFINGITGQPLEASCFMGPCYYQRLKHMVDDKVSWFYPHDWRQTIDSFSDTLQIQGKVIDFSNFSKISGSSTCSHPPAHRRKTPRRRAPIRRDVRDFATDVIFFRELTIFFCRERDCTIAFGAAQVLNSRTMGLSDECTVYYCKQCGHLAYKNEKSNTYHCSRCLHCLAIRKMNVPYAWKLLNQELIAMNICPRMEIADEDDDILQTQPYDKRQKVTP